MAAPIPLKDLLSVGGTSIFVLSTDTELIDIAQRVGGDQYPVVAVHSWAELEAAIESGRCGIALLDTELLGTNLVARITALEAYSSSLVTLVAADRSVAQELMGFLSDRKIHRLLIKPAALGITRLLIESAVTRSLQLRQSVGDRVAPEEPPSGGTVRRRTRMPIWVPVATLAALAVGVGVVAKSGWWRSSSAPRSESTLAPEADPAPAIDALFAQAEEALLANALDKAAVALAGVRRADPLSSRLAFLEAQLERSRAAVEVAPQIVAVVSATPPPVPQGPVDQPRRVPANDPRVPTSSAELAAALVGAARVALERADFAAAEAMVAEAQRQGAEPEALALLRLELAAAQDLQVRQQYAGWLATAQGRLRTGALLEPAGDSAFDHLARLQSAAPDFVGLSAAWDEFAAAVSGNVRLALAAGNWNAAEGQLAALEQAPQGATVVAPLIELLQAGKLQEEYLATAVPAGELTLLGSVPPEYPAEALRRDVEGWVELEFIVDGHGQPKNLVVLQAEPEGRFEQAALTSVAQYRYAPFERNGRVFERRARLRVRFTLQ